MTLNSADKSPAAAGDKPGFFRRNRLALFLAVVALCIYGGSIAWFIVIRGAA